MNARIATTATLITAFAGVFSLRAADPQLLSLVMPDAKVLAGANVDSAKASPFGVWVLSQIPTGSSSSFQQLITLTGFNPTTDVHEVLAASDSTGGANNASGLVVASGNFQPAMILSAATAKGALTEVYSGVTIIEDPKKQGGLAFPSSTIAIAGDVANVKGAIDRITIGQSLPASTLNLVSQWSASEDAWVVMTVPPSSLAPMTGASSSSTGTAGANPIAGVFQQIQQFAGGVKFGDSVVGTAAIQSDNATDATQLANTAQFLVNLMQMQAQKNPQAASLAKAISITTQGSTVNVTVSLPAAQFQQLIQQQKAMVAGPKAAK